MALIFRYTDPDGLDGTPTVTDLGNQVVRFGKVNLIQAAAIGEPSVSSIEFDDPAGTLDIAGVRAIRITETSAPSNNQVVWYGATQDRHVMRADSMRTGAARRWSVDLVDNNWFLSKRILTDADSKRPAETGGDRLRWLLTKASHFHVRDFGHVTYPTNDMDANDYRGQRPSDVLADIAVEQGYNFWCEFNEAHVLPELFFIDPNSTTYPSSSRVSNDYTDYDGTTTFLPYEDATLLRSPGRIASGVYLAYANGSVYVQDDATALRFAKIDQTAPMSNVKSAARARRIANHFQNDNDEETDTLAWSIKVPAAHVNDIRAGQVLDCKFTHLPGYETFRPVRITRRAVIQDEEGGGHRGSANTEAYYRIELEGQPTGSSACGGVVQSAWNTRLGSALDITWPTQPTVGNYAVSFLSRRDIANTAPPISQTPITFANVVGTDYTWDANATDGSFQMQSMQVAHRLITANDTTIHAWLSLEGSTGPVGMSIEINTTGAPEGPWTAKGPNAATMTLSGITVSGAGILAIAFNMEGFDIPPHVLTPPSELVNVVPEGYNRYSSGTQDWQSMGYIVISAAGTYSYSWLASNTFNWTYQVAAMFFPADPC